MRDKKHWYDGKFYDMVIAPNQDKLFSQIKKSIPKNSKILDVGCGTGRLAFNLADHCTDIMGIDLSSENIKLANKKKKKHHNNIKFFHEDAKRVKDITSIKFDYAILTYVIHEMPESERIEVINELKGISKNIIIGDYIVPTPKSFWGTLNIIVEYLAGRDHYANFKNFVKNGGIYSLAKETNLQIKKEIKNQPQTSHLVFLE